MKNVQKSSSGKSKSGGKSGSGSSLMNVGDGTKATQAEPEVTKRAPRMSKKHKHIISLLDD